MEKINLKEKFSLIQDYWNPRVAGELNGQQIKLVKFQGAFPFHKQETEDEMILVVKGGFTMEFRDRKMLLKEGEFLIVPHGVEHRPVADEEVEVMLFEPATTLNTGDQQNEFTRHTLHKI